MRTPTAAAPLRIAVLGASGATGLQLVRQALERGYAVVALARDPASVDTPDHARLRRVAADVLDPDTLVAALADSDVVVSGLGNRSGPGPLVLEAGARALLAAGPRRIVWLGAFGTGTSAAVAGPVTRTLLRLVLRGELDDKVAADALIADAGGTVLHAGPLTNGPLDPQHRTVALGDAPRRLFPWSVARATVAAAMLDEAEAGASRAGVLVPLGR